MKTNDELLAPVKQYYNEFGKVPGRREIPGSTTISRRFGSWNNALISAGLTVNRESNVDEETLLKSLKDFHERHGRSPAAKETNTRTELYDTRTYLRGLNCKTWNAVLKKAGLPLNNAISELNSLDDDQLIEVLKREIKNRNIKNRREYISRGTDLPAWGTLLSRFGSIKEISELLNLNARAHFYTDDELKGEILRVKDIVGHTPSSNEFNKHSYIDCKTIQNRGGWNNTLKKLGLDPVRLISPPVDYSDDELIETYKRYSEEIGNMNGATSRELNRFPIKSNMFIYRFGSINKLRVKAGYLPVFTGKKIYTKEKIISLLESEVERQAHRLKRQDINNNPSLPSISTILRYIGSEKLHEITNVKKPYHPKRKAPSKDELIHSIIKYYNIHKKFPTSRFVRIHKNLFYGFHYYLKQLNCKKWKEVLWIVADKINVPIDRTNSRQNDSKETLIAIYKEFSERIGKKNGASEHDITRGKLGKGVTVFTHKFGSINNLRIAAGYTPQGVGGPKMVRTKEEITELLKTATLNLGHKLKSTDFRKANSLPAYPTVLNFFEKKELQQLLNDLYLTAISEGSIK